MLFKNISLLFLVFGNILFIDPFVLSIMPVSKFIIVVFPAPLWPNKLSKIILEFYNNLILVCIINYWILIYYQKIWFLNKFKVTF